MYGRYRENNHFQAYVAAARSRILQSCCDSVIDRTSGFGLIAATC